MRSNFRRFVENMSSLLPVSFKRVFAKMKERRFLVVPASVSAVVVVAAAGT
jgi:hypothetical protein